MHSCPEGSHRVAPLATALGRELANTRTHTARSPEAKEVEGLRHSVAVYVINYCGALRGSMVTGEAHRFQMDSNNLLFGCIKPPFGGFFCQNIKIFA